MVQRQSVGNDVTDPPAFLKIIFKIFFGGWNLPLPGPEPHPSYLQCKVMVPVRIQNNNESHHHDASKFTGLSQQNGVVWNVSSFQQFRQGRAVQKSQGSGTKRELSPVLLFRKINQTQAFNHSHTDRGFNLFLHLALASQNDGHMVHWSCVNWRRDESNFRVALTANPKSPDYTDTVAQQPVFTHARVALQWQHAPLANDGFRKESGSCKYEIHCDIGR